jgi:tetratricopeptide (TPR) repeat protein
VLAYYSHYLAFTGNPEMGLPYAEKATELDPFNPLYKAVYGMALKNARQYDKAAEVLEDLIKEEPNQGIGLPALWAVYHEMDNYTTAIDLARKIYSIKKNNAALEALEQGYKKGGYSTAMKEIAEAMIALRDTSYFPSWQICTLYTRAEMKEETLDWLEQAYNDHDPNVQYIAIDPLFDFVRNEPRFKEILNRMKLPEINFN